MFEWCKANICSTEAANIGQFASGIAMFAAVAAVFFAWQQLHVAQASQREATARDAWKQYLRLCIDHPNLAAGYKMDGNDGDASELEKYEWFVSFMLDACESVLLHVAQKDEWIDTVRSQLKYHSRYLRSEVFSQVHAQHYGATLKSALADAIKEADADEAKLYGTTTP